MFSIDTTIDIPAPLATVRTAITTLEGFRGWWTEDTEIDDATQEATFRFVKTETMQSTFRIDRIDDRGIAMTCVREINSPDWRGTELVIEVEPAGDGTRVHLVHSGYRTKNETYDMCTKGWAFFLGSLVKYVTTGTGEPFARAA